MAETVRINFDGNPLDGYVDKTAIDPSFGVTTSVLPPITQSSFTDTNGTLLTAYTPDVGSGFPYSDVKILTTAGSANNTIQSNQANIAIANTGVVQDLAVRDCVTYSYWDYSTGDDAAIILRYASDGNMLMVRLDGSDILIQTVISDVVTTLDSAAFVPVNGTTYIIEVRTIGLRIEVYIDRTFIVEATTNEFLANTSYGFGAIAVSQNFATSLSYNVPSDSAPVLWTPSELGAAVLFSLENGDKNDSSAGAKTPQNLIGQHPGSVTDAGVGGASVIDFTNSTNLVYNNPFDGTASIIVYCLTYPGNVRLFNAYTANNQAVCNFISGTDVLSFSNGSFIDDFQVALDTSSLTTTDYNIYAIDLNNSQNQLNGTGVSGTTSTPTTDSAIATYLDVNGFLSTPADPDTGSDRNAFRLFSLYVITSLSNDDLDRLTGYIAHQADRLDLLPVSHPYKVNPPLVP